MQIWLKNHNFCDIFYTSKKCSFIPLCLDFTKFGTLSIFSGQRFLRQPKAPVGQALIHSPHCWHEPGKP